MNFVHAIAKL